MTKIAKYHFTGNQKIPANAWTWVQVAAKSYSFYPTGPSDIFTGQATVVVDGMPVGKEFKLQFRQIDYNLKSGEIKDAFTYPNVEVIATGGDSDGQVVLGPDSMGKAASGWQRRMRLAIWAPVPVTVKSVFIRTAY